MLSSLVPALIVVVCTEGYFCNPNEKQRMNIAQPSYDACMDALAAMPRQPQIVNGEQRFAVVTTCGMVSEDELE